MSNSIANTIRDQIGQKALVMLGAHDMIATDRGLQLKFRGSHKCNVLQVELADNDTYTVRFSKWQRAKMLNTITGEFDNIHAEELHGLIERNTGLYTSL